MDERHPESLKPIATELANLISSRSDDLDRMAALLECLKVPGEFPAEKWRARSDNAVDSESIGIWKLSRDKDRYEREANRWNWHHWADISEFQLKKEKQRIVLLGESVARAMFYSPGYTVAAELEAILNSQEGMDFEVLDLAKSSILMDELSVVAAQCQALEPDAMVIFAGNNWHSILGGALGPEDYWFLRGIFEKESLAGIAPYMEEKLAAVVREFFKGLGDIRKKNGIPLIFVIPEFNLKDWKSDETERVLPWTHNDSIRDWLDVSAAARNALQGGRWSELIPLATKMVTLDPFNPSGHELLGQAYAETGECEEARNSFERARDTAMFEKSAVTKPRCLRIVRQTILSAAATEGIEVVDLPNIFKDSFGGDIPDRRLFLDYCHLTAEGIKMAMRHTAALLVQILTGRCPTAEDLAESGLYPTREVQATAHFSAAIHNAHAGQPYELLHYHCHKAVSLSASVKESMLLFTDFSSRAYPSIFCKSFEGIIINRSMKQYESGLGLIHRRNHKLMDIDLVNAVASALGSVGTPVKDKIDNLRMEEHVVGSAKKNLLQSYYSTSFYKRFSQVNDPDYVQARTTRTCFSFIADASAEIAIEVTYRTPGRDRPGKLVRFMINEDENVIFQAPMSLNWSVCSFDIDRRAIRKGYNRLIVEWPYTSEPLQPIREDRLTRRAFASMIYPVLGEIYSLTANKSGYE